MCSVVYQQSYKDSHLNLLNAT